MGAKSPPGFRSTVVSIFGAPGTGKTSLVIALLMARGIRRYVMIDPYGSIPAQKYDSLRAIDKRLRQIHRGAVEAFAVSYVPGIDTNEPEGENPAERLARWAVSQEALFIIDEAHEYCDQYAPKRVREKGGAPSLLFIARQGRHHGSGIWLCSQRPAAISRDLTANSERYFLRLDEPADLDYVKRAIGSDLADLVAELEPLHYVYRLGKQAHLGKITWKNNVPSMETVRDLTDLLPRAKREES